TARIERAYCKPACKKKTLKKSCKLADDASRGCRHGAAARAASPPLGVVGDGDSALT
uniref:Uncharacterized protein n=1 Tax=Aegilops tauschii subsp. strangulata TaxID=200361 RepID=A0A453I5Q1_AEGTS